VLLEVPHFASLRGREREVNMLVSSEQRGPMSHRGSDEHHWPHSTYLTVLP